VRYCIRYHAMIPQIVIDTCVVISALRSRRGASYRLLMLADGGRFDTNLSVSLLLEYEQVAKRFVGEISLTETDIDDILDYLCQTAIQRKVYYLWRPFLKDPQDDMVLELAVSAGCRFIVTFNIRDFAGAEQFGIRVVTPQKFLQQLGDLP
jgi:putative PIN family toxin of toxin-antitoxin system